MDSTMVKRVGGATTVPLPLTAIVGIAVGGAVILFSLLAIVAVLVARRKNRRHSQCDSETAAGGQAKVKTETAVPTGPLDATFASSKRLSYNPFMPLDDEPVWDDGMGEDGMGYPPRRKSRRLSAPRGPFRIAGMRDSWPLVSNIPMSLIPQSSSTIHLNNVAAPGYEIFTEPKWPKRTASRNSRTTVSVQRDSPRKRPGFSDPYSPTRKHPKRNPHIRSASENQLSTILRSTSQRLKAANKNPLTRTLTNLNRTPVSPPIQPLPRLPNKKPSESREQLVDSDHESSVASSVYDLLRSPNSPNRSPRRSAQTYSRSARSPAPSITSEDSLCMAASSDFVASAALTSPSKNKARAYDKQRMRFSSPEKRGFSTLINGDRDATALESKINSSVKRSLSLSSPHRMSLSGDPFFSDIRGSNLFMPGDKPLGPRPLYIRKTTFGADRAPQPAHLYSPLQHISGNAQAPIKKPMPPPHLTPVLGSPDQNPFQWSTQEAMQTRSRSTSPTRRQGHRRSKVVRIVQIPRPLSVAVVPEESEEDIPPNRCSTLTSGSYRRFSALEPMLVSSSVPAPLSVDVRMQSTRPPSIATFNPSLNDLTKRSGGSSQTTGMQDIMNTYSPMLVENNYYADSPVNSEEDFFARSSHSPSFPSRSQSQQLASASRKRQNRTRSAENLFPSSPLQGKLVSFPAPDLSPTPPKAQTAPPSPRPSPRPLPQISTIYSPTTRPGFMQQSKMLSSPLPPLLTIAIPDHLTGPRAEPTKRVPDQISGDNPSTPMRASMQTSIGMLRRMNSDVSTLSPPSSNPVSTSVSPHPEGDSQISRRDSPLDQHQRRGRTRGSKSYLSMGKSYSNSNSTTPSFLPFSSQIRSPAPGNKQRRVTGGDKRDSHQVYKERRRRRHEDAGNANGSPNVDDFLRGRGLVTWAEEAKLTPVKEVASSPPSNPASGVRIPGLNLFNARQNAASTTGARGPAMKLVFPTLTPTGASRNRIQSAPQNSQQSQPLKGNPPAMSTMMGVGTTADFFKVDLKEVDGSAFEAGSESDTNTETSEDLAYKGSAQHESEIQFPIKPVEQQQMVSEVEIDRAHDRDSLLDLYSYSRALPPPDFQSPSTVPVTQIASFNHPPFTTQPARWSDATPQPTALSVRRESKMEHPSPKTPPLWVWSAEGLGLDASSRTPSPTRSLLVEALEKETEKDSEKSGPCLQCEEGLSNERGHETEVERAMKCGGGAGIETPRTLGLYDSDGFYAGSTNVSAERIGGNLESRGFF